MSRSPRFVRHLSDSVTFTAIGEKNFRLRVPLLKSPSHLGHHSSRGNRRTNEDRYSAAVMDLDSPVFAFGVYDGHGGLQCLTFLRDHLAKVIEEAGLLVDDDTARQELIRNYAKNIGGYWKRWYKHRNENLKRMQESTPQVQKLANLSCADDLMSRLPLAFLQTDYRFFNEDDNALGSTCLAVFLHTLTGGNYFERNSVSKLTVAHVGDTRAILVDRNGFAHALTSPHHPLNPMEARRLRKYAANFFMTDSFGEERFVSLANTRAFGDLGFKQMGVTAEPDVSQYIIGDASAIKKLLSPEEVKSCTVGGQGGDESFLVLCTDGVSNEITDQEIADIVMANYNLRGLHKATPQFCAEEVVRFVDYVGGDDNSTCMVIRLGGWGLWPVVDRTGLLRQERLNAYTPRDRG